jgi:hypothetical protein
MFQGVDFDIQAVHPGQRPISSHDRPPPGDLKPRSRFRWSIPMTPIVRGTFPRIETNLH